MSSASFVLVHLGDRDIPDYLYYCVTQIRQFNRAEKIYIILDRCNEKRAYWVLGFLRCIIVFTDELERTAEHEYFLGHSRLVNQGMNGFWQFSTERFFLIEEVMLKYQLVDVIHIENDVLLYIKISSIIKLLRVMYHGVALTQDHDDRVIGGIVYIPSVHEIHELNTLIASQLVLRNDMEVLCEYLKSKRFNSFILNLPVVFPSYLSDFKFVNQRGENPQHPEYYYNNFERLGIIFDAASLGQYVGGIDKIHSKCDTRGFINETAYFTPEHIKMVWLKNPLGKIPCIVEPHGGFISIANLHIHSKELYKYISRYTYIVIAITIIIKILDMHKLIRSLFMRTRRFLKRIMCSL